MPKISIYGNLLDQLIASRQLVLLQTPDSPKLNISGFKSYFYRMKKESIYSEMIGKDSLCFVEDSEKETLTISLESAIVPAWNYVEKE